MLRFSSKSVAVISNLTGKSLVITPKCFISGKTLRGSVKTVKPAPYPYQTKKYGLFNSFFDKTSKRIDENSKVILVEGPLAVGKSKFAQELAEELEMKYIPEATMDLYYINSYGYDMRKLDSKLPENCRSFDVNNFLKQPTHFNVATFQLLMYTLRYSQYVDALAHLLSTGEGVILDRSVYSDFVFLEAMFNSGYISKEARSVYHEIKNNTITELLRPHLVVYLDAPVNVVKDKIKARNNPNEVNSKALTDKYLTDIDHIYKQSFLKEISGHADLLIYDWSAGGDTEVVVEDIERLDFSKYEGDLSIKKLKDWRFPQEGDWCEARIKYCNEKDELMNYFNIPRYDVPELLRKPDEAKIYKEVWFSAPGMKYDIGYNEDMGDKGIITKNEAIPSKY